jgi:hypothetical protein
MFQSIDEYMLKDRNERRNHLDLDQQCMEIGGTGSKEYKGLLAHFLKTTIPTNNRMIHLCHACNNPWCSNPNHLYWGTPKDNLRDSIECGTYKPIFQRSVEKYGIVKALEMVRKQDHSGRESKAKLTDEELLKYENVLRTHDVTKWGWKTKAAKELGISHTHVKRIAVRLGLI